MMSLAGERHENGENSHPGFWNLLSCSDPLCDCVPTDERFKQSDKSEGTGSLNWDVSRLSAE